MKLEAPQLIWLAMMLFGMGINAARYGQPKTGHYDMIDVLIGPALVCGLLWWGGFFG